MKVAIVSVQVPFIRGGAELLAEACKQAMLMRNIHAEIITIPFKWYPPEKITDHVKIARIMDITEVNGEKIDKVICLKFPAYLCQHNNKTLWLLHQHRQAYDLFDSPYGDLNITKTGRKIAKKIRQLDNEHIPEHKNVFTISENIARKLKYYNGIQTTEVLYPPPMNAEKFYGGDFENYILYPSRFSDIKRQELIVKAMQFVTPSLKLILLGDYNSTYGNYIQKLIEDLNLKNQVILKSFINEEEKFQLYANCLAVYNGVYDEDYGYVTIESFLSCKPVIIHPDAGGPLEFVVNGENGFVVDTCPQKIAEILQDLFVDKKKAAAFGQNGYEGLKLKKICWDYTIEKLIS